MKKIKESFLKKINVTNNSKSIDLECKKKRKIN